MSLNQYQEGDVTREVIVDYFNKALPGVHCLHDYTDLKKLCSSAVHDDRIVWIQGPTGSGQTHLFRKLRNKFKDKIIEIGKFMVIEKDKVVGLEFTADAIGKNIFVGNFPRHEVLLAHLAEVAVVKGKQKDLDVVYLIPDFRFFIELHKFRLSEMRKADLHRLPDFDNYKEWAIRLTNLNGTQFLKSLKSMITLASKHIRWGTISVHRGQTVEGWDVPKDLLSSNWSRIREYFYVPPIEGPLDHVSIFD